MTSMATPGAMPMGEVRKQTAWVLWDHKKDRVRARKTKPDRGDVGTNEFVTRIELTANIPDSDLIHEEVALEFDVPTPMLESAVAEALDTRSFLDWQKDAESAIAERIDEIREADDDVLVENIVNGLTVQTLRAAKGRPDIDAVERYIAESVEDIRGGDHE